MARRKVWCRSCGNVWHSLRDPPNPDCFFCGVKASVEPVVPDQLAAKLKETNEAVQRKAMERASQFHEQRKKEHEASSDDEEHLAARGKTAGDVAVRAALAGKADEAVVETAPSPVFEGTVVEPTTEPPPAAARQSTSTGRVRPLRGPEPTAPPTDQEAAAEPEPDVPDIAGDAQGLALQVLKGSEKTKGIFEWFEKNKELISWLKTVGLQVGGALERHSQRQYQLQKEQMEFQRQMALQGLGPNGQQQQQVQQAAPELPPFEALPLEQRMDWVKRGGRRAYLAQNPSAGAAANYAAASPPRHSYTPPAYNAPPAPTYAPAAQPMSLPPMPANMAAGMNPQAGFPVPTKDFQGGKTGLAQARAAIFGNAPPQRIIEPQSGGTSDGIGLLAAPYNPPQSSEPAPAQADDNNVPGEEILPPEMRDLPKEEKKAILLANDIVKSEHAHALIKAFNEVPPEHVRELVFADVLLLNKKVKDVAYLLPVAMRNSPVARGLADIPLRDCLPFMPEAQRNVYANMVPEALVEDIVRELPDRPDFNEEKTKAWLVRNLTALRDSLIL